MTKADEQNPMKENIHTATHASFSNDGKIFPCYARTEKRFKPYFTKETGDKIAQHIALRTNEEDLTYNQNRDYFILLTADNQKEIYSSELILTDEGPMRLYPIGSMQRFRQGIDANGAWQWQEVNKAGGSN